MNVRLLIPLLGVLLGACATPVSVREAQRDLAGTQHQPSH